MKKTLLLITLFITGVCFAQKYEGMEFYMKKILLFSYLFMNINFSNRICRLVKNAYFLTNYQLY